MARRRCCAAQTWAKRQLCPVPIRVHPCHPWLKRSVVNTFMTQKPAHKAPSLFDWNIIRPAVGGAFRKLDPRLMIRNPVMFVTMVGALLTTISIFTAHANRGFILQLAVWLWFTVLFANLAEAVAEGRGKAQADSLRKARKESTARRLKNGKEEKVPATELQKGDVVV